MFRRNQVLTVAAVLALGVLVACGGGSSVKFAAPATGSFNNSSLKGSYALSITGQNTGGFFVLAASLVADGNGNITSGVQDVNASSGVFTNVPVTGTYTIGPDGRGTAVLNSSVASVTLDFVIISPNRALVIRFDGNATASGSMDLQDSSAFTSAALQGQFAFAISGIDPGGNAMQAAGTFTTNGAGVISSGSEDVNDAGGIATNVALTGVYTAGSNGRGTMTLNTTGGPISFAFYVVSANHIKMVETDSVPVLAGDAYRQQAPFANGNFNGPIAFTLGGGLNGPFVAGGVFNADGNGTISAGTLDVNDNGNVSQNQALTGTYSIAANGRGTLALTPNGTTRNFVVYPSVGGIQILEVDTNVVSSGVALAQSSNAFSNASLNGNYGYNLSGVTGGGEVDIIAKLAADGTGKFKGAGDFNLTGSLFQNLDYSGTYSLGSNGRGTAALKSSNGTQNLILYAVDGTRVLFIEADTGAASVGTMEKQ